MLLGGGRCRVSRERIFVGEGGYSRPHCDGEEVVGFVGTTGAGDARDEVHDA